MSKENAKGTPGNTISRSQLNDYANRINSNNTAHIAANNNHANQCNPNYIAKKIKYLFHYHKIKMGTPHLKYPFLFYLYGQDDVHLHETLL